MNTLDKQLDLEEMYNKHSIDRIITKQIDDKAETYTETKWYLLLRCADLLEPEELIGAGLNLDDMAEALWIELLRNPKEKHIQSIGTLIGNRLGFTGLKSIQTGTAIIEATAHLNLFDMVMFDRSKIIRPLMKLDDETLKLIEKLMYQPPMVCIPNDWKSNKDGGWLSVDKHAVLGKGNSHNQKLNLDVLNKLQHIPWMIDQSIMFQFVDKTQFKADSEIFIDYLDTPFYFVWRYDKRGRMYSEGYNINLQSNEYRKAMISMAHTEKVSPEGMWWLKIAVANAFGQDKLTFKERIKWFNRRKIFDVSKAEDQILATKMIKAYQDAINGKEINTNMFLDATASGLQISAALSGCEKTAAAVNMIGIDREDPYGFVADGMNKHDIKTVTRDQCKYPLMTHYYNSKERPKQDFDPDQLIAFYEVLDGSFPGAEDVLDSINQCWSDKEIYVWTLPDGHKAVIRSKVTEGANIPLSGTEFYYEYTAYRASGNSRHLAPNIIHSIDGWIAREMVRRCDFPLAHIHDAFTCHPNHMTEVCDTYRVLLIELCESNLLQSIVREVTGNNQLAYKKLGYCLGDKVKVSNHTLS